MLVKELLSKIKRTRFHEIDVSISFPTCNGEIWASVNAKDFESKKNPNFFLLDEEVDYIQAIFIPNWPNKEIDWSVSMLEGTIKYTIVCKGGQTHE